MLIQNEVDDLWHEVQEQWIEADPEKVERAYKDYWQSLKDRGGEVVTHSGNFGGYDALVTDLIAMIRKLGGDVLNNPEWDGTSEMSYVLVMPKEIQNVAN